MNNTKAVADGGTYKSLESLRGIAALIVALFHSGFAAGEKYQLIAQGEVFVDFFFILSGFVMTYAYADKIAHGLSFKEFFLLRFGRLYPLHLFMLLVWLPYILAKAYLYTTRGLGTDPFEYNNLFTFVSNLLLVNSLGVNDYLSWNTPAWSISVEFFAYSIFFAAVLLNKQRFECAHLGIASMVAYGCLYALTDDSLLSTYQYGLLRCLGGFFLGAFLFKVSARIRIAPHRLTATLMELCIVALALFLTLHTANDKGVQLATFIVFGIAILIFASQSNGIISKLLETRYMVLLGMLSYSIYMVHAIVFAVMGNIYQFILKMPVRVVQHSDGADPLKLFDTPYADWINLLGIAIIIAISYVTYTYIEKPYRNKFRAIAEKYRTIKMTRSASNAT